MEVVFTVERSLLLLLHGISAGVMCGEQTQCLKTTLKARRLGLAPCCRGNSFTFLILNFLHLQ
jgi:hypothetical protein